MLQKLFFLFPTSLKVKQFLCTDRHANILDRNVKLLFTSENRASAWKKEGLKKLGMRKRSVMVWKISN
jgi:hypothetical protein